MSFEHPWLALLALVPLVWAAVALRGSRQRTAILLKAASLAAILAALAQPVLSVWETKQAVTILVDTSASIPQPSLDQAAAFVQQAEGARGRHHLAVVPFARRALDSMGAGDGRPWQFAHPMDPAVNGTDIEAALGQAMASLPADLIPRVVLLSDGHENAGSAIRAAWQARQLGIPVDTLALPGHEKPLLRVESLSFPGQAYSGERFPIDLTVVSPSRGPAKVELTAEGKPLGASGVMLEKGVNQVRVYASVRSVGAVQIAGQVASPGQGVVHFTQAVNLKRPRVLLISDDPPGAMDHLLATLSEADFEVRVASGGQLDRLDDYQIVVLNNWDHNSIAEPSQLALETFVKQGGGLAVIAGERNSYREPEGPETPLERALPARIAPPRSPKGNCVVLIIDKSSSMEGKKMELARVAAIGVVDNLRPIDQVGVLIFDNSFEWTVPIRRARNSSLIKRLISGITPDGGTQIAPAIEEAYRKILTTQAVVKHIVLLTDGISEEGNSVAVSKEAGDNEITISTIGLGQDVNRAYLDKIATLSGGKAYFLNDPSGLQQILVRDVLEHTGATAVEKPVNVVVERESELLRGVEMAQAPPLEGYVRYEAKPTSETVLRLTEDDDPLLVRWQYGLGRATVFASDAKSRWAAKWIPWAGYDVLWANLFHDLLPHAPAGEAVLRYESANDELVATYRLAPHLQEPRQAPDIFVFGPDGFRKPIPVQKLARGHYEGRLRIDNLRGLFRARPLEATPAFPEAGLYRQESERFDYGTNEFLLRQIAGFTGGRFGVKPGEVFAADARYMASSMRLWPGLLALALLLNLAELLLRKWPGVKAFFQRFGRPAESASQA